MKFEVRLAKLIEKEEILKFIDNHWKKGHIYTKNIRLFDYLHLEKKKLNIVIAKNLENQEILAIHAFIPYEKFDRNFRESYIFLSIWKVREDIKIAGLGLRTIKFIENNLSKKPLFIQALGYTEEVEPLYRRLGYSVGFLSHHVLINHRVKEYKILKYTSSDLSNLKLNQPRDSLILKKISSDDLKKIAAEVLQTIQKDFLPEKSKEYLLSKYQSHPTYHYMYCGCEDDSNNLKLIFIYRQVSVNGANVLRIVDIIGSEKYFKSVSNQLTNLLFEMGSEYIDLYHFGLNNKLLEEAGFVDRKKVENLTIPNHFEPFEDKNIDIQYAFLSSQDKGKIRFFKGDGDQDRPSLA